MGQEKSVPIGSIGWIDLTVEDAPRICDFYRALTGWTVSEVDMGGYSDYCMTPPDGGAPVAGVCHARGSNADLPPQWLIYIAVEDLDQSLEACVAHGGAVVAAARRFADQGRYAVIRDPAGAVAALFEPAR